MLDPPIMKNYGGGDENHDHALKLLSLYPHLNFGCGKWMFWLLGDVLVFQRALILYTLLGDQWGDDGMQRKVRADSSLFVIFSF